MGWQVKFRDQKDDHGSIFQPQLHGIAVGPRSEMFFPLADNVVRQFEVLVVLVFKGGQYDVINITLPIR